MAVPETRPVARNVWERGGIVTDAPAPILVINPNSSPSITEQIAEAVGADDVRVVRSSDGPPAIETDEDVVAAVGPMIETAAAFDAAAVVACFSDPGLTELRDSSPVPAFGIAESALRRALELGDRVGVISSVNDSLPRHARHWRRLGLGDRVVADIPLGLGVLELNTGSAYRRAEAAGRQLLAGGADVIVLGCTGMTHMRARLGRSLRVPVVDPCRAAVDAARTAVRKPAS